MDPLKDPNYNTPILPLPIWRPYYTPKFYASRSEKEHGWQMPTTMASTTMASSTSTSTSLNTLLPATSTTVIERESEICFSVYHGINPKIIQYRFSPFPFGGVVFFNVTNLRVILFSWYYSDFDNFPPLIILLSSHGRSKKVVLLWRIFKRVRSHPSDVDENSTHEGSISLHSNP